MTDLDPTLIGLETLSNVQKSSVNWLWPGYLPAGKVAVLDGDPGVGKSMLTCELAARISVGAPMPGESGGLELPADVILFAPEDDMSDTVIPRLEAHGADLDRIHNFTFTGEGDNQRLVTMPDDFNLIEKAIKKYKARLIIIDPVVSMLSERIDTHKDHSVRTALTPLARIASENECTILLVRHLRKGEGPAIYKGGGSVAFIGISRIALCAAHHPTVEGMGVMAVTKTNLGPKPKSMQYKIEGEEGKTATFMWQGTSTLTADELLAPVQNDRPRKNAATFLKEELSDGPKDVKEILEKARQQEISERTLERAKTDLGIQSARQGQKWEWRTPDEAN
jgi:hypothetical protein